MGLMSDLSEAVDRGWLERSGAEPDFEHPCGEYRALRRVVGPVLGAPVAGFSFDLTDLGPGDGTGILHEELDFVWDLGIGPDGVYVEMRDQVLRFWWVGHDPACIRLIAPSLEALLSCFEDTGALDLEASRADAVVRRARPEDQLGDMPSGPRDGWIDFSGGCGVELSLESGLEIDFDPVDYEREDLVMRVPLAYPIPPLSPGEAAPEGASRSYGAVTVVGTQVRFADVDADLHRGASWSIGRRFAFFGPWVLRVQDAGLSSSVVLDLDDVDRAALARDLEAAAAGGVSSAS